MVSRLEMVLKELNDNGDFSISLFCTATGLVLASAKGEVEDDKTIAAMGSLLSDAAYKAAEELSLKDLDSLKLKFSEKIILMRNLVMDDGETQFILAVLASVPDSEDVEKYYDQLLDWAVENAYEDLKKLSSI
jgi:predicted regulator of Ras-like GTPase activity (Roadblock/LC7/MglB family)